MKRIAAKLGLLLLALAGAFLSIWTCVFGAMATGLEGGGWNWQFIPFVALGGIAGILLAILALILCGTKFRERPEAQIAAILIGPPLASFFIGAIAFPVLTATGSHRQAKAREQYTMQQARMGDYLARAREDPEIVLRERWLDYWDERRRVLSDNMAAGTIPFSEEQLERMYKTWSYGEVFTHPACSAALLARYFGPAAARAENITYTDLAAIVSNPNTPLDLVEQIAASTTLPVGAVYPARDALKKRRPETSAP